MPLRRVALSNGTMSTRSSGRRRTRRLVQVPPRQRRARAEVRWRFLENGSYRPSKPFEPRARCRRFFRGARSVVSLFGGSAWRTVGASRGLGAFSVSGMGVVSARGRGAFSSRGMGLFSSRGVGCFFSTAREDRETIFISLSPRRSIENGFKKFSTSSLGARGRPRAVQVQPLRFSRSSSVTEKLNDIQAGMLQKRRAQRRAHLDTNAAKSAQ